MGRLDERVKVVTEGNVDIGFALAEPLLDAGATVDIRGRSQDTTAAALERLSTPDRPKVTARQCHMSDEVDVERDTVVVDGGHTIR